MANAKCLQTKKSVSWLEPIFVTNKFFIVASANIVHKQRFVIVASANIVHKQKFVIVASADIVHNKTLCCHNFVLI